MWEIRTTLQGMHNTLDIKEDISELESSHRYYPKWNAQTHKINKHEQSITEL